MQSLLVVVVCVGLVTARISSAEKHAVGGNQGWDESADFNSWASGKTFKVGDQLVFKYSTLHSVVELGTESAYKNCDLGTTLNSMSSGNDVVKLAKPGTRYFACGTPGHCDQGMKAKINVVAADAPSSSFSSSSPSSSSDPGQGSGSGSASGSHSGSGSTSTSGGHGLRAVVGFATVVGLLGATLVCVF